MGIIVGKLNPKVIGGVDDINKGKQEVVIDSTEQSADLKPIDEVKVQKPEVENDAPVEVENAPAKRTRTRKTAKK